MLLNTLQKLLPLSLACPVIVFSDFIAGSDQGRQENNSKSLFIWLRPPHIMVRASTGSLGYACFEWRVRWHVGVFSPFYKRRFRVECEYFWCTDKSDSFDNLVEFGIYINQFYQSTAKGVSVSKARWDSTPQAGKPCSWSPEATSVCFRATLDYSSASLLSNAEIPSC